MNLMQDKIRVLLVENDMDFIYLIKKTIENTRDIELCTYAETCFAGIELAISMKPEVVLVDLNLSGTNLDGIDAARQIRIGTDAKVLLLTSFEQPSVVIPASKRAFACGYIFKSQCQTLCGQLRETARTVTVQEQFIYELILQDLSSAERSVFDMMMGKKIEVLSSEKTIANQKTTIFKKLGLRNQQELQHVFRSYTCL